MVKHIVLWTFSDEAKKQMDQNVSLLQGKFKNLLGKVDGLQAIEVEQNYNGGDYDVALYCEFSTKKAQEDYQSHPAHLEIKKIVHSFVVGRTCVDYEI